jgi:hypothetical protein
MLITKDFLSLYIITGPFMGIPVISPDLPDMIYLLFYKRNIRFAHIIYMA